MPSDTSGPATGMAGGTPLPDAGNSDAQAHSAASQRRALERLVALTRDALEAAVAGDADRVAVLDVQRRESIEHMRGFGAPDPHCAELARQARALDAELLACVTRQRDELATGVRGLHARERARRSYAATDSLLTGTRYL